MITEYTSIQQAYDYFNNILFAGKLPYVMITLQHGKRYNGYAWQDKFISRNNDAEHKICELALNPDAFNRRSDKDILSTLVHEQCHIWQFTHGKTSRNGYHNKQWGDKMKEVGLYPSATGSEGGKETGQKMTHYIINQGAFDTHCNTLITGGFKLNWQSFAEAGKDNKKKQTRAKFVCPECDQAAWAKPTARLYCGECSSGPDVSFAGQLIEMLCIAQDESEDN